MMLHRFPALLSLTALALSGCHVFDDGAIDQTCNELPNCGGSTYDTGLDTANDANDIGFAIASFDEDASELQIEYIEGGEVVYSVASEVNQAPGFQIGEALEYDVAGGIFYFALTGMDIVSWPVEDSTGKSAQMYSLANPIMSLESDGDYLYADINNVLKRVNFETAQFEILSNVFESIDGLFADHNDSVYVVDRETISVSRLDSESGEIETVASGFDDGTRLKSAFIGYNDELYTCSSAGAIYSVANLADGNQVPSSYSDDIGSSEVAFCAYDPATTGYVLATQEAIYRLNRDGSLETIATPPIGSFVAIDFVY